MRKMKFFIKLLLTPCALYLLALMPRIVNRPDTGLFLKKYFAHRGLHDNGDKAPENSMAAFRNAVEAGYGIELDVHVTRDGIPVIFHDSGLERMCGTEGNITDYTYEELQQFTLGNTGEHIPKLEDLLFMVQGRVPLIVEIKSDKANVSCCTAVDRLLRTYNGEYCIESFNPMVLWWFRLHHNRVVRGQLSSDFRKDGGNKGVFFFLLTHLMFNFITKPDFIAYNREFKEEPGRRICRKLYGNPSVAWTVRNREELYELRREFDVFIFENFTP